MDPHPPNMIFSDRVREVGVWFRETIIITMNEIAEAVIDDVPDDLDENNGVNHLQLTQTEPPQSTRLYIEPVDSRKLSSSNAGEESQMGSSFDFPSTINSTSLISRINALYSSPTKAREPDQIDGVDTPVTNIPTDDHFEVVDVFAPEPIQFDDDSEWIKL